MTDEPKFCRACRHVGAVREPDGALIIHRDRSECFHPDAIIDGTLDLVVGQPRRRAKALLARTLAGHCGPDGKKFELAVRIEVDEAGARH